MRIPLRLSLLCAGALGAVVPAQEAAREEGWQEHRDLKVLYAGCPDGSREKVFAEFLRRWFDDVGTIHLGELNAETAADWDVVIADWISQYGNDGYEKSDTLHGAPCNLPADFTKPVVAMTYVGTNIRGRYKLDWL